jgi:arylsulfatase A
MGMRGGDQDRTRLDPGLFVNRVARRQDLGPPDDQRVDTHQRHLPFAREEHRRPNLTRIMQRLVKGLDVIPGTLHADLGSDIPFSESDLDGNNGGGRTQQSDQEKDSHVVNRGCIAVSAQAVPFAMTKTLLLSCALVAGSLSVSAAKPNFVLIVADNLGYGDVGCFGSKINRTPALDRMAAEGMKLTSFYVGSSICTPSRAAFMTACYPSRVSMEISGTRRGVLQPVAQKGLSPGELTIAEALRQQGYATMCIGKWHLGDQPQFLPTRQGFDGWLGVPYSEDMIATTGPRVGEMWPPMPLVRNETVIEAPVDPNTLTRRYTEEAKRFIQANRKKPFFLYLPHAVPGSSKEAFASEQFRQRSKSGIYGACVEELDWSTGEILRCLREEGLDDNTLVIWTSDNGAFQGNRRTKPYGQNLPLRGTGGTAYEGGFRVPCIVRWPNQIPTGAVDNNLVTSMDLFPTFVKLAGGETPTDRKIDGKDVWPILAGARDAKSPHDSFLYYARTQLRAVRSGKWKLHLPVNLNAARPKSPARFEKLQLFDLEADPIEAKNLAAQNPSVVARLSDLAKKARETLGDIGRLGTEQRPAGWLDDVQALRVAQLPSRRGFPTDAIPLLAPGTGTTHWDAKLLQGWAAVSSVALNVDNRKQFFAATIPGDAVLHNTAVDPAGKKAANIQSAKKYGDLEAHVEFQVASKSNSGVYLMGRYEIQILDSFGKAELKEHDAGAIYQRWDEARTPKGYQGHAPKSNASRPAGEWQSLDIKFRAPRFDKAGKKIADAEFVSVELNGVTLHEHVTCSGPTRGSAFTDEAPTGPLMIQGNHGPVALRNVWIRQGAE